MKEFITSHPELFRHVFCVLTMIAGVIYISKLENRNFKLRKESNKNAEEIKSIKEENVNLKFNKILVENEMNQLKKDNYNLSRLNNSLNNEIAELKNEIASDNYGNGKITISSRVFVNDTKKTEKPNKNESQLVDLEENVLCNNLFLFESKKKCWRCNKMTKVICLGTNDSYTLFDNKNDYERYQHLQLLSYVKKLPIELADFLKKNYRYYLGYSQHIRSEYYINHCEHCGSIQGDNYIHEVPEEAIYKHLCYKNTEKANYYKFINEAIVPIQAQLPYYDDVAGSFDLMLDHMVTEKENRASLNINQKLIDKLIEDSNYCDDIEIKYL